MLWEGDSSDTKLSILLLFSNFAQKLVLLRAMAEDTTPGTHNTDGRGAQGTALGFLV